MPVIKGWCALQVLVTHPNYEKQYTLTSSRNHVAMSLCRNKVAFARQSLRMQLLKMIEKSVKAAEMMAVCTDPMLMGKRIGALKIVSFDSLYVTIQAKAPILMGIMRSCIIQLVPKYTLCHSCV